jgi:hypothetical protein
MNALRRALESEDATSVASFRARLVSAERRTQPTSGRQAHDQLRRSVTIMATYAVLTSAYASNTRRA